LVGAHDHGIFRSRQRRSGGGVSETTEPTALALRWFTGKGNTACGDGVTGAVYLNGQRLDEVTIAFNDGTGTVRVYYATVAPGDVIDLVVQPDGLDGGKTDGCDGTVSWLRIDDQVPPDARQPDGSLFAGEGPAFIISGVTREAATGRVTLTWPSSAGDVFDVHYSRTLATGQWSLLSPAAGVTATAATTSFTDTTVATEAGSTHVYYRVTRR